MIVRLMLAAVLVVAYLGVLVCVAHRLAQHGRRRP